MITTLRLLKLSWSPVRRQFYKTVGKHLGRDGTLKESRFDLGPDEAKARVRAIELKARWRSLRNGGQSHWPSRPGRLFDRPPPKVDSPVVREVAIEHVTILDAANVFLDDVHKRAEAQQVSWAYYRSSLHRMKRLANEFGCMKLLADVGEQELNAVVLQFASRPPAQHRPHQKRPEGEPISRVTARQLIGQVKAFFVWASEHELLDWHRPKRFDRIFKIKYNRLVTPQEREARARSVVSEDVDMFLAEELERLFKAGRHQDRLFLLLALNCGFTTGEIADLRTFEVFLDGPEPFVHRVRNKTKVEARWILWPETLRELKRHKAPKNAECRWLLTKHAKPFVEVNQFSRRDAIDQGWKTWRSRARLSRDLGFRFLRKTGASAVKRLGGLEESEMYLSHAEPGINKAYANRNWSRMWKCLTAFRAELRFLDPSLDMDPGECLFTYQSGLPDDLVDPPFPRHVTKRSETGHLNVSLHKGKGKFGVRIYRKGRTHCKGYHATPERAAVAAQELRRSLDLADLLSMQPGA